MSENENIIKSMLPGLINENSDIRNESELFFKNRSQNIEIMQILLHILSTSLDNPILSRLIPILLYRFDFSFSDSIFDQSLILLKSSNHEFLSFYSLLISKNIINDIRLNLFFEKSHNFIEGATMTLSEYCKTHTYLPQPMMDFFYRILCHSDIFYARNIAADAIYNMTVSLNKHHLLDLIPNDLILFSLSYISQPFCPDNIPILISLVNILQVVFFEEITEDQEISADLNKFLNIQLIHFIGIANLTPFGSDEVGSNLSAYAENLASNILTFLRSFSIDFEQFDFSIFQDSNEDPMYLFVRACILCCLYSDDVVEKLSDINNIGIFLEDNNLRCIIIDIFDSLYQLRELAIHLSVEITRISPRHQEAGYFILSNLLNGDEEIDIPPPHEDPLCLTQYLYAEGKLRDSNLYSCFDTIFSSDNSYMRILGTYALSRLDEDERYSSFISMGIQTILEILNITGDNSLFSIMKDLSIKYSYVICSSPEILNNFLQILLQVFPSLISDFEAVENLSSIIVSLHSMPRSTSEQIFESRIMIHKIIYPLIINLLHNSEYIWVGCQLLSGIVEQIDAIEDEPIPELIEPLFQSFYSGISLITQNCIQNYNDANISEFKSCLDIAISISAFFLRIGKVAEIQEWFLAIISINDPSISYWGIASIAVRLIISNNEIVKPFCERIRQTKSKTFIIAAIDTFCTIFLLNRELFNHLLQIIPNDVFSILAEEVDEISEWIDIKCAMTLFLAMQNYPLMFRDSEQTASYVGCYLFQHIMIRYSEQKNEITAFGINEFEKSFDDSSSEGFCMDPLFKHLPIRHNNGSTDMTFSQWMETFLQKETIPPIFQRNFHTIFQFFHIQP